MTKSGMRTLFLVTCLILSFVTAWGLEPKTAVAATSVTYSSPVADQVWDTSPYFPPNPNAEPLWVCAYHYASTFRYVRSGIKWNTYPFNTADTSWYEVQSIKVRLYSTKAYASDPSHISFSVSSISTDWSESSAQQLPSTGASTPVPLPTQANTYYEWSIADSWDQTNRKNAVKYGVLLFAGVKYYSGVLQGSDTAEYSFPSRTNANSAYHPKLTFTFTIVKAPFVAGASATQNSITLNINRNGIPSGVNIHVYRNGNLVGTISDASSVFTDTGLQPGTSYTYTLRAEYLGEWGPVSPAFSYRTVPPTPSAPSASTSIIRWSQTVGRGRVVLTWPAVNGATGYKVWVFDGNTYRGFDVGNTTTWDSSAAKIYPDPNWLGVQPDNSISSDPFNHQGAGFDLQDDPNLLYRKTVGTAYDNAHNYWFRVSAYNESGEAPMSGACTVALPLATDQEPPSVSVSATSKQGFKKTYTPDIYVAVSASDSLSKLRSIELSNDGVSYTRLYEVPLNPDGSTSVGNYSGIFEWTVLPGAETKIIYVRVVDAVGNSTVATDAVVLAEDVLPPSVQLKINGGAEFTTQPLVTLTLSAYDNTSPVSQLKMRFSNDGNLWSPWQPFQESMLWDIANGLYGGSGSAGIKKVYAQVVDQAENVALVVAQIGYNPNPPNGSVTIMNARPGIWEGELAFFITTDKPSIALNIPGAVQMRFDLGTGTYSDWESYAIQKTVLLPKYQGAVRLRVQTKDAYGVISKASDLLVVVDSVAPTIQRLRGLNGATATTSSSITLEISATDNLPGQLQYQYQVNGGSWSSWANLSGNTINVSGLTSGANRIAVNVKDLAGNVSSATVTIFRI